MLETQTETNTSIPPRDHTITANPSRSGHKAIVEMMLDCVPFGAADTRTGTSTGRGPCWTCTCSGSGGCGAANSSGATADDGAGSSPDTPCVDNGGGVTALGAAAIRGHAQIVRLLARHHHDATSGRNVGCESLPLWLKHCDVNARSSDGSTSLLWACFNGHGVRKTNT